MSEDGKRVGAIRSALATGCVVLLLVGLLLIPFVPTEVSIGIAVTAVLLYFVIKLLMPKNAKVSEPDGSK